MAWQFIHWYMPNSQPILKMAQSTWIIRTTILLAMQHLGIIIALHFLPGFFRLYQNWSILRGVYALTREYHPSRTQELGKDALKKLWAQRVPLQRHQEDFKTSCKMLPGFIQGGPQTLPPPWALPPAAGENYLVKGQNSPRAKGSTCFSQLSCHTNALDREA